MTRKKKRQAPDLPPQEGFAWLARQQRRVATKNGNHTQSGYVDEYQAHLEELSAAALAEIMPRYEASLAVPLDEKVPEYVIAKDDHGQVVGIERRL